MVKMANIIYLMSLAQFLAEITGEWVVPWVGVGLVGSAIQTSHFVWLKNWRWVELKDCGQRMCKHSTTTSWWCMGNMVIEPCQIWNADESRPQACWNGTTIALASCGVRQMNTITLDKHEHLLVLSCINAAEEITQICKISRVRNLDSITSNIARSELLWLCNQRHEWHYFFSWSGCHTLFLVCNLMEGTCHKSNVIFSSWMATICIWPWRLCYKPDIRAFGHWPTKAKEQRRSM